MKKKSSFSKLHWTTKILKVYLIKNSPLIYFLFKKWWSCDCFFFHASEAPKNFWGPQKRIIFWILDLKICLKKLGIGSGWYGKSVLYLLHTCYFTTSHPDFFKKVAYRIPHFNIWTMCQQRASNTIWESCSFQIDNWKNHIIMLIINLS